MISLQFDLFTWFSLYLKSSRGQRTCAILTHPVPPDWIPYISSFVALEAWMDAWMLARFEWIGKGVVAKWEDGIEGLPTRSTLQEVCRFVGSWLSKVVSLSFDEGLLWHSNICNIVFVWQVCLS